jgi:16S rRNA (cytosine967-C5)-methyltransferase
MIMRSPALSETLMHSSHCLAEVQSGHSLTEALAKVPKHLRSSVHAVSWYAMRHWGLARAWRALAVSKTPAKPWLNCHIGLSVLLLDAAMMTNDPSLPESHQSPLGDDCPRYSPYTLVDEAVKAVGLAKLGRPAAGLVNAVLRRFQRERHAFVQAVKNDPLAQWSYQDWWIKKIQLAYPNEWKQVLSASQSPPRLVLRINKHRSNVPQVIDALRASAHPCVALGEQAVMLEQSAIVETLPGFREGWWSVQDWSAQQAAALLSVNDGHRVLDACAAPGGKSAHLLELANVELTALDHDAARLKRVFENLTRLKLMSDHVHLKVADVRDLELWWDKNPFDRILADVPCTASGVVRRHPDIAWLKRESDVAQSAQLQSEILDALWSTLAPSGMLLLVTCSVFPEEGEEQARSLLKRQSDAVRLPAPGQCLPMSAGSDSLSGQDGFFYALFQRLPTQAQVSAK